MQPDVNAAFVLVDYAWQVLKANDPKTWAESKYGGMVPIVPLSEEPELDDFDGPHIVYGYADNATGDLHARSSGSTSFAIYDQNFRRMTKTLTILKTAFERQDETARDVNEFSTWFLGKNGQPGPYLGLRFGYIQIGFLEGGTPETAEGGRQSALLNVTYEYYTDYDVVTKV